LDKTGCGGEPDFAFARRGIGGNGQSQGGDIGDGLRGIAIGRILQNLIPHVSHLLFIGSRPGVGWIIALRAACRFSRNSCNRSRSLLNWPCGIGRLKWVTTASMRITGDKGVGHPLEKLSARL
jgi:hypothetical protein